MPRTKCPPSPCNYDLFGDPIVEPEAQPSIVPLDFESYAVRMVFIKGDPWWVLADVARILGYRDAEKAKRLLRSKHWGTPLKGTPGIQDGMILVSEAGLYRLMMRSDMPEAERFQDWITEVVLPTIRRTGGYSVRRADDRVTKTARRLKCDRPTAIKRVENTDFNKATHHRIATAGGNVRDFAAWHDGGYMGQFGMDTPTLRHKLGIGGTRKTPLDRMGLLPLAQNGHAKALAERIIDESPVEIPLAEQPAILEKTAREIVALDLAKLGKDFGFGVIDDPARGTIIDVVRNQLAAS